MVHTDFHRESLILQQIVPKRAEQTLPLATSLPLPLKQLRLSRNDDGPWFSLVCDYCYKGNRTSEKQWLGSKESNPE